MVGFHKSLVSEFSRRDVIYKQDKMLSYDAKTGYAACIEWFPHIYNKTGLK